MAESRRKIKVAWHLNAYKRRKHNLKKEIKIWFQIKILFERLKKRKYEDNREEKGKNKKKGMKRTKSQKRKEVTWCNHVAFLYHIRNKLKNVSKYRSNVDEKGNKYGKGKKWPDVVMYIFYCFS